MNEEGILVALKLGVTDAVKQQLSRILNNCDFEADELNRIVQLNDKLVSFDSYITMSSTHDYFKIKNEAYVCRKE